MTQEHGSRDQRAGMNQWHRAALWLVIGTLVYNVIEATVALWSGAEAGSIALFGFGLDSVIETIAASVLLWRLAHGVRGATDQQLADMDRRVYRVVGATFLLLAAYILFQSGWTLIGRIQPEESLIGIGLAIASVVIMPLVSFGKIRAAKHLQSRALLAEAKETLACSYLSLALLLGLLLNSTLGWWWADPVAALIMVPWIIKEGLEGVRDGDCDCHGP